MSSVLASLKPKRGSTAKRKLLGRGRGSGKGGTASKGHKGQKARSGGTVRWGFEGGQTPLARRSPKFGFSNRDFQSRMEVLNLSDLASLGAVIDPAMLIQRGLIGKGARVKILGRGELAHAVQIKAHAFSASALKLIEKAGGKAEVV